MCVSIALHTHTYQWRLPPKVSIINNVTWQLLAQFAHSSALEPQLKVKDVLHVLLSISVHPSSYLSLVYFSSFFRKYTSLCSLPFLQALYVETTITLPSGPSDSKSTSPDVQRRCMMLYVFLDRLWFFYYFNAFVNSFLSIHPFIHSSIDLSCLLFSIKHTMLLPFAPSSLCSL